MQSNAALQYLGAPTEIDLVDALEISEELQLDRTLTHKNGHAIRGS